ncbi:MAG: STAS domain-containing protein [Desulfobacterales bacterium]|nr:STAS domain-containing protein [Desulfobacterales bacterium]
MKIEKEITELGCTIILSGRLDAVTAPELEGAMEGVLSEGQTRVIMNLTELEYISSAGLRVFLIGAKKLKAVKGELILAGMTPTTKEVIRISGFPSIMPCFDTMAQVPTP